MKLRRGLIASAAIILLMLLQTSLIACSTFVIRDDNAFLFGRNFDFPIGYGYVTINKSNVAKTSFIEPPEKPLTWISKYGSISFNQIGREFPYGGLNEAGLLVEQMWLSSSKYPALDERKGLTELQWIQYQLDCSATVEDVIASDSAIRVSFLSKAPLHFLVCDKKGSVATIEYIDGKMNVHRAEKLPIQVLTNSEYQDCLNYVKGFEGFGGTAPLKRTTGSLDRFATAASMVKDYYTKKPADPLRYSFDILQAVSQGRGTKWSIVYDVKNMEIYYKTVNNGKVRKLSFHDFNYDGKTPVTWADIDNDVNDIQKDFVLYDKKTNRELIENVFNNVGFLKPIPKEFRDKLALYPETVKCNEM